MSALEGPFGASDVSKRHLPRRRFFVVHPVRTRDLVDTIAGAGESRVSAQTPDDLCDGQADERMLRYARVNLFDNALKYSPPATLVSVWLPCEQQEAPP